MQDLHAPSPEFTRFLEWQTRTELRRRDRLGKTRNVPSRLPRLARTAALILVCFFAGGGAVFAVERIQESREQVVLLRSNQLQLELAERRVEKTQELAAAERRHYEMGFASESAVSEAEQRVAEIERDRDHLRLDREEMLAGGREVDTRLSAPLVGSRDFVSEHLRVDLFQGTRLLELQEKEERAATLRFESGFTTQAEAEGAHRGVRIARAELERLEALLALRSDYLLGRIDRVGCEQAARIGDAEHRLSLVREDREFLLRELEDAKRLEEAGMASGAVSQVQGELDELEVEIELIALELDLLR